MRRGSSGAVIASLMTGPEVTVPVVSVIKRPRLTRSDRLATPCAHGSTCLDQRTHTITLTLVCAAVPAGCCPPTPGLVLLVVCWTVTTNSRRRTTRVGTDTACPCHHHTTGAYGYGDWSGYRGGTGSTPGDAVGVVGAWSGAGSGPKSSEPQGMKPRGDSSGVRSCAHRQHQAPDTAGQPHSHVLIVAMAQLPCSK